MTGYENLSFVLVNWQRRNRMPKFSIITPTWNRVEGGKLHRCLASVMTQTYHDFEHIVVDDGSRDIEATRLVVNNFEDFVPIKYIEIPHQGRVIARNTGMRAAKGEWICWLDSDDALDPMYLETLAYNIDREPDACLWVVGAVVHGILKVKVEGQKRLVHTVPKWTKLRKAWMPPVSCDGNHTLFNSGHVGTGMFVFRRECLETTGLMPPFINHNQLADGLDEWLGVEPGATGYNSRTRLIGNPNGDDHAWFQKLCLYWQVHLIDACLYVQYVR
jgi:glycosyltransferase involved in cell wall biosynthesis